MPNVIWDVLRGVVQSSCQSAVWVVCGEAVHVSWQTLSVPVCLSVCLAIYHLSICVSVCLSVYHLCVCLSREEDQWLHIFMDLSNIGLQTHVFIGWVQEVCKLFHISRPISVGINGLVERTAPALQQLFLLVL